MRRVFVVLVLTMVAGCAHRVPLQTPSGATIEVPRAIASSLEVVAPTDKDYATADVAGAIRPAGEGGVVTGVAVRLTRDQSRDYQDDPANIAKPLNTTVH